jgi:hypothetical protein
MPEGGQSRGRLLEGISAHTDLWVVRSPSPKTLDCVATDPVSREPPLGLTKQEVKQSKLHMVSTKPVTWLDFGFYGAVVIVTVCSRARIGSTTASLCHKTSTALNTAGPISNLPI